MLEQIKKVKFGAPAAERDINQGLKEYFVETGAFNRLKENKKSIILGNRGTGKSALMKMIIEHYRKNSTIVIEMFPEDYSYELLQSTLVKENDGSWAKVSAYTASWKYLIWVLIMKEYSEKMNMVFKTTAKKSHVYLRDNHKGVTNNFMDLMISYLKRIEGLKIGAYEAGIKTKELQGLYKLEEINNLIPEIIELSNKRQIVINIDELDKGWDASEDAKAFIAGLFQASISINQHTSNIKVVLSVRKELHDNIPSLYEDYQKNIDLFETLEWDDETLFNLIVKRIRYSIPELKNKSDKDIWNTIFIEKIFEQKSLNYIVSRSLYRPREIIQLCTEAQSRAIEKRSNLIDINAIITAEAKYSENRTKDIAAEYKFQYPDLINIFEAFRGSKCTMTREELEILCLQIISGEIKTGHKTEWITKQNEEFLINILWQIGFLTARTTVFLKNENCDNFFGPHQVSLVNLSNIKEFSIHPMFRLFLGIREQ